jgi:predicted outer membrane protein
MKPFCLGAMGLLCSGVSCLVAARTANPTGAAPDTPNIESGHPPDAHANTADQLFIRELGLGGMAEAQLGKLAAQKAQNPHVKEFARRMADDHGKANEKLVPLARAAEVLMRKDFDLDPSSASYLLQSHRPHHNLFLPERSLKSRSSSLPCATL